MTHTPRSERREEIKLRLEYIKLAALVLTGASLIFGALQWKAANIIADTNVFQRMVNEWRDHLKTFIEHPQYRPYFEEKVELCAADPCRQTVLALADVRLDVMDAVMVYANQRSGDWDTEPWRQTFVSAFRTGPVLCQRIEQNSKKYAYLPQYADEGCKSK